MKFYWYSDGYLETYIQNKRDSLLASQYNFGDPRYKKLHQINKIFSPAPWGMLHDISNNVSHPFNVITENKYSYRLCDKNFKEVCLDVAKQIVDSTDRKISVNWSGGIDSTVALVSMLQTVPSDQLVVVCDQNSIDEYPTFYHDVIKNKIETISLATWFDRAPEFFSVSGDAGDTVWAIIDDTFWNNHHDSLNKNWRAWAKSDMIDFEFIEEFCSWSGVNINSVLELRTWFYLCCKWQDKATKIYRDRPRLTRSDAVGFYNYNNDFQIWTMNNLDKIVGPRWTDYKMPAKKFIYDYHDDKDYLYNKTKMDSPSIVYRSSLWQIKNNANKFAIDHTYHSHCLPSWPFVDQVQFEDWNDQHQLIPHNILEM